MEKRVWDIVDLIKALEAIPASVHGSDGKRSDEHAVDIWPLKQRMAPAQGHGRPVAAQT